METYTFSSALHMMRVCNPSAINIAIKATKLPPLKGC